MRAAVFFGSAEQQLGTVTRTLTWRDAVFCFDPDSSDRLDSVFTAS